MTELEARKEIEGVLDNLDECYLIDIHNTMCDECNCFDDYIYSMSDIDGLVDVSKKTLTEVYRMLDVDFNDTDYYWSYNAYGFIESFNDPYTHIYESDIIDNMIFKRSGFGNSEIEEIIENID